jgi:hypothetical protein
MPKARKTRPLKRKQATPRRRNRAVSLLTKWATASTRVQYIEQSSGLQHMGTLRKLGSPSDDEFIFFTKCGGAQGLIYPLLWTDARVEGVADLLESVFITEGDRR